MRYEISLELENERIVQDYRRNKKRFSKGK